MVITTVTAIIFTIISLIIGYWIGGINHQPKNNLKPWLDENFFIVKEQFFQLKNKRFIKVIEVKNNLVYWVDDFKHKYSISNSSFKNAIIKESSLEEFLIRTELNKDLSESEDNKYMNSNSYDVLKELVQKTKPKNVKVK